MYTNTSVSVLVSNAYSLLEFDEASSNELSWSPFDYTLSVKLTEAVQAVDDCGDESDAAIARLTDLVNEALGVACGAYDGDCTGRIGTLLFRAFDLDCDPDPARR